jgi:hypothetical protein
MARKLIAFVGFIVTMTSFMLHDFLSHLAQSIDPWSSPMLWDFLHTHALPRIVACISYCCVIHGIHRAIPNELARTSIDLILGWQALEAEVPLSLVRQTIGPYFLTDYTSYLELTQEEREELQDQNQWYYRTYFRTCSIAATLIYFGRLIYISL